MQKNRFTGLGAVMICAVFFGCSAPITSVKVKENTAPVVMPAVVKNDKIVEGWVLGKYPTVESGPYFSGDFRDVMARAAREKKLIFVSVGRDQCPNTTRFYHYLESGLLPLSTEKFIYVKFDGDNYEHVDLFHTYFELSSILFPFVGVMNGEGATFGYRGGYGTAEQFTAFIQSALAAEKKWQAERH